MYIFGFLKNTAHTLQHELNIVSFQNVIISQQGQPVLHNVHLDIIKGETIYLVGRSGSGKSTLLKTIYGQIKTFEGKIHVLDTTLNGLNYDKIQLLRRKIGMVFQDILLFDEWTVGKNLWHIL